MASAIIQVGNDGDLGQISSSKSGGRLSDSEYILKIDTTVFDYRLKSLIQEK